MTEPKNRENSRVHVKSVKILTLVDLSTNITWVDISPVDQKLENKFIGELKEFMIELQIQANTAE